MDATTLLLFRDRPPSGPNARGVATICLLPDVAMGPPPKGSKVRLVGLKNPELSGKIGHVVKYSPEGDRVMVSLEDSKRTVKLKPKQIALLRSGGGGGGGGGRHRRPPPPRGRPGDRRQSSRGTSRENGHRREDSRHSARQRPPPRRPGMGRVSSDNDFHDSRGDGPSFHDSRGGGSSFHDSRGGGSSDGGMTQDIMETLREADDMFEMADTSGDGAIDYEEFEAHMMRSGNTDRAMIRDAFDLIDADGNGDITRDEVRNAFLKKRMEAKGGQQAGLAPTPSFRAATEDTMIDVSRDADALFDKADYDGNGTLSNREFELYLRRHTNHSDAVIHQLINTLDEDNDGFITREEVYRAFKRAKEAGGGGVLQGVGQGTLKDILNLDDDDMADIEDDVYNMFFLSETCSSSFWFAIIVFVMKIALMIIIVMHLFANETMPTGSDVPVDVKVAQFILLFVNVSFQEELITTFSVYANMKWSKHILKLNPGASKAKYHCANIMRCIDGIVVS